MSKLSERASRSIEWFSLWATDWSGRSETMIGAIVVCLLWGISGPFFHFSDTWQLIINTLTSVVTFVMVFLIQRAQNKSSMALQLKLNEIIAAIGGASNRLIAVEELSEDDLRGLHHRYQQLAEITNDQSRLKAAFSVEAVEQQLAEAEPRPPHARRRDSGD